ncbi:MAG: cysteine desulfurase family protein [Candidatus Dormibacteria bacterium]
MNEAQTIYLDHAATTPIAPEARDAVLALLTEEFGNPSSLHSRGRAARVAADAARDRLAAVLGCGHGELVFTSGGTEANNLAIRGVLDRHRDRGRHVVVSTIEHDSVLATTAALTGLGRAEATLVGPDAGGRVSPEDIAAAVRPETILVSVMLVNNEVGTVQDVGAIASLVRERNPETLIHADAVQALGRIPVNVAELGVDLLSLSGHKVYGPKGVGALYIRRGTLIAAQLTGGGQERNRRSGTENTAGIAGFGRAVEVAEARRPADAPRLTGLARGLMDAVTAAVPDVVVTGASGPARAPGFATLAFPGARTDLLLTVLDRHGICASGGSACSSGASIPSHVLGAMGLPPHVAGGALRLTPGRGTTEADMDHAARAIISAATQVREDPAGAAVGADVSGEAFRRAVRTMGGG